MNKRNKKSKNKKRTDENEFGTNESGASKTEENQENLESQTGEITDQTQEDDTNVEVEKENQEITNVDSNNTTENHTNQNVDSTVVDHTNENSNHHEHEENNHKSEKEIEAHFESEKTEEKNTEPIEEKISNEKVEEKEEVVPVNAEQEKFEEALEDVAVNEEVEHEKVEEELSVNTELEKFEEALEDVAAKEELEHEKVEEVEEDVLVNAELEEVVENVAINAEIEELVENINKIEEHAIETILEDANKNDEEIKISNVNDNNEEKLAVEDEAVEIKSDVLKNIHNDSADLEEIKAVIHKHVPVSAYVSLEDAKDSSVEVTDQEALNTLLNAKLNEVHTLETEEHDEDIIAKLPSESKQILQNEVHVNLEDSRRNKEEQDEVISKQKDRIVGKVSVDKKESTVSQKMEKFSEVPNSYSDVSSLGNVRKSKADQIRLIDEINIDKEKDHNLDEIRKKNNLNTSDAEVPKTRSGVCSKCIIY